LKDEFREIRLHPDFTLSNGALVEVKATRDKSGSNVISSIRIEFPKGMEIPLGGITARVLRELPLDYLRHETGSNRRELVLTSEQEERLLMLLKNFPSSPGRVPILDIYGAATAYFYEKFLNQKPYKPNVALSAALETPVTTIAKRVATARANGFLESGQKPRSGGTAKGALAPKGKKEILKWLRPSDFDYGAQK
jgi:hypothetical protein